MEQQSEDLAGCEVASASGYITVAGEIDLANSAVIARHLLALLHPGHVVLDCRAVRFLDVSGLRMFLQVGLAAIAVGVSIRLRCSPVMTETFDLCMMREVPGLMLERDGDGEGAPR